ncbi:hypothetical protein B4096_2987 [Heyndrickxia coagulans]|jgi:hypothetical protein|uniref:Uncharacterized protein n=1 Tax=Heyndrickxia coagulans TaxID=1398 RepID=A0A0C5C6G6_HEYCO|nr:hypothetical protein SB48_HM08orf02297 [Heyndrickxia coagulans]KWZ84720.1 hypothetical protein HMPREF3213_00810 [Heyndrickxia coagulans]KYC92031.1 hypothetical protein B4096_2987 [Heyndrickxia coagulans]
MQSKTGIRVKKSEEHLLYCDKIPDLHRGFYMEEEYEGGA